MRKNKALAGVMTAALVLGSLTLPENISIKGFDFGTLFAQAAEEVASGTCGDDLTWVLDDEGVLTISGTGEMDDYNQRTAPWYSSYRSDITSIIIEDGVTSIGTYAFYFVTGLISVEIPDSVTSIGEGAFCYCNSLESVRIPEGVTSIEDNTFNSCICLTEVEIFDGVTSIGDKAFCACTSLESFVIPASVISIGDDAFDSCGFSSIEIPDGVTSIGDGAFSGTNLESISIPASVVSMGDRVFYFCESLVSADISEGVTTMGDEVFSNCKSLESITIPDSVTSMGEKTFYNCKALTTVKLSENLTSISDYTFYFCYYLTDVEIPDGVTSIGDYAFYECNALKSMVLPDSVTTIGMHAFSYCKHLSSIVLSDNLTSIGDYAFSTCTGLTSIELPDGLTTIGDNAFYECSSLTSIEIPDSVTSIGESAFSGCKALADEDGFVIIRNVLYDYSAKDAAVVIPDGVTAIAGNAFVSSYYITSVEIPDSVTYIGDGAFRYCTGLADEDGFIVVQNVLYGYYGDETEVKIPDGVTAISGYTFFYDESITSVEIPDGVTSIGAYAFALCFSLVSIKVPSSVISIGEEALDSYSGLTVYGYSGSAAETYVDGDEYSIMKFVALPEEDEIGNVKADLSNVTLESGDVLSEDAEIVADYVFKGDFVAGNAGRMVIWYTVSPLNNGDKYLNEVITDAVRADDGTSFDLSEYDLLTNIFDLRVMEGNDVIEGVQNVEVSFDVYALEEGMEIALIHYDTTEGVWEVYDDLTVDGINISTTISSLSPVAVIYKAPTPISECDIQIEYESTAYTGSALEPQVTIEGLEKGVDYTVAYENNTNVGTASVIVTGIGDYRDTYTATFEITKMDQTVSASVLSDSIVLGETSQITAEGIGEISYTSSDEDVAMVSEDGLITAVEVGTAVITVTFAGDDITKSASTTIEISVVEKPAYTLGDINQDDEIDYLDAMQALRYDAELIELDEAQLLAGDVNGDEVVDSLDAILILRYDADLITEF